MYPYFNQPQPMPWTAYQQPRQMVPQQQIVQVSGADSLNSLQMAPNSSLLAMHQTAPIVYLCQSDGVGKITFTAYDIAPHKDEAVVLRESIDARITALEETVARMEVILNAKSDTSNADVKQADPSNRPCPSNDASGTNGWQSRSGSATNGK